MTVARSAGVWPNPRFAKEPWRTLSSPSVVPSGRVTASVINVSVLTLCLLSAHVSHWLHRRKFTVMDLTVFGTCATSGLVMGMPTRSVI